MIIDRYVPAIRDKIFLQQYVLTYVKDMLANLYFMYHRAA